MGFDDIMFVFTGTHNKALGGKSQQSCYHPALTLAVAEASLSKKSNPHSPFPFPNRMPHTAVKYSLKRVFVVQSKAHF